jgi:hypothetical protein
MHRRKGLSKDSMQLTAGVLVLNYSTGQINLNMI